MQRIKILESKKISLVVPEKEDISLWYKGMNNLENQTFLANFGHIFHKETEEEYYEIIRKNEKEKIFVIYLNEKKLGIGNISLMNIDYFSRNAEISVIIFDKKYQDKGYGTESMKLILKYAFEVLGLHKVFLRYIDSNKRAEKVYKNLGFKKIGTKKEEKYMNSKYHDEILMELLKKEYNK